jgi:hypothetical protein
VPTRTVHQPKNILGNLLLSIKNAAHFAIGQTARHLKHAYVKPMNEAWKGSQQKGVFKHLRLLFFWLIQHIREIANYGINAQRLGDPLLLLS